MSGRGNSYLRALDRYAGIPLVLALGATRSRHALPSAPQSVGVLNTAAIGDTILMGAAIADLRAAYPGTRLIAFSGRGNAEAVGLLEGLDAKVTLSLSNLAASVRQLRKYHLDLLFDFGPWPRINAVLSALAGAKFTVGFYTVRQHRHYAYDIAVEHRNNVHELENYRSLVRAIGLEAWHLPALNCGLPDSALAQREKLFVFHLWPGGTHAELKEWPFVRWIRLASELITECDRIVLTGAPGQFIANEALLTMIGPSLRSRLHNAAGLSLDATASLLARSSLVVSVNTGIMHLAASLGVPLIALHGPTSARRWGPIGPRAVVLESPCAGCGYLDLGFEYHRKPRNCMHAISYRMVREACTQILIANSYTQSGASLDRTL
jgi:ADP-heptose:LPS heptosyltransferase